MQIGDKLDRKLGTLGRARALSSATAIIVLLLTGAPFAPSSATEALEQTFATPKAATDALLTAMRRSKTEDLVRILGPQSEELIRSGDPVADREAQEKFVAAYGKINKIVMEGGNRAHLEVGTVAWPFTIPLVREGRRWHFDVVAGKEEILNRRIGRNELNVIEVCKTFVEAENEYARDDHLAVGYVEYAQKFLSTAGKHDGLYWPTVAGEEASPLGPLVASARAEGYDREKDRGDERKPYHGYLYKILTRQGPAALGGAHDYLADGHMIGGFALVAIPARYGDSGIMTFLVSHEGEVFEKDLGPDTETVAKAIDTFNPDESWRKP